MSTMKQQPSHNVQLFRVIHTVRHTKQNMWLLLLLLLSVYESEEYYRASVQPELEDGSSIAADVYVWKDQYR